MKNIKFVSIFIMAFVMFSITSCDNEPLEGEFSDGTENGGGDNNGNATNCADATNNLATATTNFNQISSSNPNYSTVCNDYITALQEFQSLCGDTSGTIQAIIDSLDCTGNPPDDCESAQATTQSAEAAYNADTSNSALCNAYEAALQAEISFCGDANGELQAIIDGLDCSSSNNGLLPRQIIETYGDGSTVIQNFTFTGNRLVKWEITYNYVGSPSEMEVYDYTYENDLLVRIDENTTDSGGNPETSYSIFEYDSNNRLISETIYFSTNTQVDTYEHNSDGTITLTEGGEEIYILTFDGNGNLVTQYHTNGPGYYVNTYDNKNSYGKNVYAREIIGLFSERTGSNNLLTKLDTGGSSYPDNQNITYTYNSDDYPLTSTTVENEGTAEENTFTTEYYYY
ncbi:hypothetical protein [Hanstruepera ponticola]|uniref:hypothetical protein n=1 Tax=Hanstruepera ponticola TaxID=2042995 RepID=UPI0013C42546|nr:hypothetical protein [Hanstruepera ponticola]